MNNKLPAVEHPITPSVLKAVLADFQNALKRLYPTTLPKILLYGSYARGEANQTSDIDILLLYPLPIQPGEEIQRLSPFLADLNIKYQVLISVLPASESDYILANGAFWTTVKQEGVLIDLV